MAAEEYPSLDCQAYLTRIESLARLLSDRLRRQGSSRPERQLATLNDLFFDEHAFRGNVDDYYDPRNSYLNEVLDRRLGIPLTLAVVYVAVGRGAGLPLEGVGFPGHFLVAYDGRPRLLIDPFNAGRLLSVADCEDLLHQQFGSAAQLDSAHLAATPPRQILLRLVTNLKVAYQRAGDLPRAIRASEQLSVIQPSAPELRERGLLRFRLADFVGSTADLSRYLEFEPAAPDADAIRRQLTLMRQLRDRRN